MIHPEIIALLTEERYQQMILDYAHSLNWLCYHTRDSRRSTHGFPDIVLVRERVVYVEVKSSLKNKDGKLSDEQVYWLTALQDAGQEVYAVWPRDYDWLIERLA